jgi:hypothetical protein
MNKMQDRAEAVKRAKQKIRKNAVILLLALLFFIPSAVFSSQAVYANLPSPEVTEVTESTEPIAGGQEQAIGDPAQQGGLGGQGQGEQGGQGGQGDNTLPPDQSQAIGDPDQQNGGLGETLGDNEELNELFADFNITSDTTTIDLIILINILTVAPSLLIMLTSFTRIIIAFSLLRNAMGIAMTPPNQIMIGLALFMTFFIMSPVFSTMNEVAYVPYKEGEISSTEALSRASDPLKLWMLQNTSNESMDFFLALSDEAELTTVSEEQFI